MTNTNGTWRLNEESARGERTRRAHEESARGGTAYLDEDEHTGDEDEGHVEGEELQQRQGQTAFVAALLYRWRRSVKVHVFFSSVT